MSEPRLRAALDALVPPIGAGSDGVPWQEVRSRAGLLRRRRRRTTVTLAAALSAATFGGLAASGQIGALVSHSKAPHLVVRATFSTAAGPSVGAFQIEIERAVVAFRAGVRVLGWRTSSGDAFSARWFLDVRGSEPVTVSLLPIGTLCTLCSPDSSGRLALTRAQVAALVRGDASVTVTLMSGEQLRGRPILDRSSLRRGVMCLHPALPAPGSTPGGPRLSELRKGRYSPEQVGYTCRASAR
jgi:hypothetical protein